MTVRNCMPAAAKDSANLSGKPVSGAECHASWPAEADNMHSTCSGQPLGKNRASIPILLVDSEDTVDLQSEFSHGGATAWEHLQSRDGWPRPLGTDDDQAQMMVTCMETWILSDRKTLRKVFGAKLQISALLPVNDLEQRSRSDVLLSLENTTHNCDPDKAYSKGKRSFQVLAELDPGTLMSLPHFERLIQALNNRLPEGPGGIVQCRAT